MSSIDAVEPIVVETTIAAPAKQIFEALTNPEHRTKWWGAEGRFRVLDMTSDLRPGGAWVMNFDSNGRSTSARGEYRRIEAPTLLEFTWLNDWHANPSETLVRFDLVETNGVTKVRVTIQVSNESARAHRVAGHPRLAVGLRCEGCCGWLAALDCFVISAAVSQSTAAPEFAASFSSGSKLRAPVRVNTGKQPLLDLVHAMPCISEPLSTGGTDLHDAAGDRPDRAADGPDRQPPTRSAPPRAGLHRCNTHRRAVAASRCRRKVRRAPAGVAAEASRF